MAKVVLENIYKSFPLRPGEPEKEANTAENASPDSSHSTSNTVLRRINLTIEDGEFMVLVGPSGCGKSTLLRSIAGLEALTAGNIWVGDRLVNDLPPKDRDIAMVFQNYALYPHLTVYDNLAFGLRRSERGKKEEGRGKKEEEIINKNNSWVFMDSLIPIIRPLLEDLLVGLTRNLPKGLRYFSEREKAVGGRVMKVAQLLQIESLLNRLPKQLSGGQKQRVALGRAMARNPEVFLMDEPLSNLDAKLRGETRSQIVQLQRQLGTTTIYVTHDQTEAMTMGDRIAIMNGGQVQQVAQPLELYNRPANLFVAEFIGSPPMNFLPVQFTAPLLISHPQFRFTLPDIWAKTLRKYDGKSLILGIRPEHLTIHPPATKNLSVQVDVVEALGHETYLQVSLTDAPAVRLQVRVPPERSIRVGEELWLAIAHEKIHLFDPDTELAIFG
ncbi:ABC transporter ATP-binding protein [Tychonema bourrellyi FEM_GT703]|uniref:ABC transporter ATP-binding protein n=1 Tax=Tychonema bourrellyi FEM_GT703 TaxID=2040638 RepID=A0A2G4EUS3_9CYAN|nr:ABC transporter ATP-binding protein [Tychonema bourrellyi]PHX53238.1 ABC transporter ATP-binding protein [Tychonema bourrellyi FEM_GT703]